MAEPARVATAPVTVASGQGVLELVGELDAARRVVISAEVAGAVHSIDTEEGEATEAQSVLAQLRAEPAQLELEVLAAEVKEARAGVERAEINERRLGRLIGRKAVSQDEYDSARVELRRNQAILAARQAEAALQADRLQRHTVRAPFAGTVVERQIEKGQWLDIGDPCFVFEDAATLRVRLAVPQDYLDRVQLASSVKLYVDVLGGETRELTVIRKLPQVRRGGRSFEVWLELDNRDHKLVPGLSVRAEIALRGGDGADLQVPRDAVLRRQGGESWIWIVQTAGAESTARKVAVDVVGARNGGLVVRAAGLEAGAQVVTRGNEALREAQQVLINNGS